MGEKAGFREGCGTCLWVLLLKLELARQATKCGSTHHPFQPSGRWGAPGKGTAQGRLSRDRTCLQGPAVGGTGVRERESRLVWEAQCP